MPAGCELGHGRANLQPTDHTRLGRRWHWLPRRAVQLTPALAALLLDGSAPAQAGLLGPLLQLLRPQLETRLASACVQWASDGDATLAQRLQRPCTALAGPTSRCLVEESERSGRTLAVISELVAGRFGDDSELVVKRCASRLLGLPADSLRELPLRQLAERFRSRAPQMLDPQQVSDSP
jgi:hypothetical protein